MQIKQKQTQETHGLTLKSGNYDLWFLSLSYDFENVLLS